MKPKAKGSNVFKTDVVGNAIQKSFFLFKVGSNLSLSIAAGYDILSVSFFCLP